MELLFSDISTKIVWNINLFIYLCDVLPNAESPLGNRMRWDTYIQKAFYERLGFDVLESSGL